MEKIAVSLFVAALFTTTNTFAASVESSFNSATGTIVLPNLVVGGQVYYVHLTLIDSAALTFQVNLALATDITPTAATAAGCRAPRGCGGLAASAMRCRARCSAVSSRDRAT